MKKQPTKRKPAKPLAERIAERAKKLRRHNRLMAAAIDRYLELHSGSTSGNGYDICDEGGYRKCLPKQGYLCHWCELSAARSGEDAEEIHKQYVRVDPDDRTKGYQLSSPRGQK